MSCPLLYLRVENRTSEILRVNEAIALFCDSHRLPSDTKFDVMLSVEEALSNIIRHSLPCLPEWEVTLNAAVSGGEIQIRLEDNGPAFDPLAYPPPNVDLPLTERRCGGLGIYLVKRVMDHVHYERKGERNFLIMTKTLEEGGRAIAQRCP